MNTHKSVCVWAALLVLLPALLSVSSSTLAIERNEVLVRAQTYVYHPWHCSQANKTASCSSGYDSAFVPGDYLGLPYDWGGYMSLYTFDQGIQDGLGAGSYSSDGVLDCTVGLDCSGFVSKAWDIGHYTTSNIETVCDSISSSQALPGDAFNVAGYHVILFGGTTDGDWPLFYEAIGYGVIANALSGWSNVTGFSPVRYSGITGAASVDSPVGTAVNPIPVGQFPFVHNGNTATSLSDMFDHYGADTTKNEAGPEVVYELTIDSPGTLTVQVQDGDGVDIDVHVCSHLSTFDCIARHDTFIQLDDLSCGTWYVIADSWTNASGQSFPGAYTLTVDFQGSAGTCPGQNEPYEFQGAPGGTCQFPGNSNLPMCNPTLGADTCLYTGSNPQDDSFCTMNCSGNGDCLGVFAGGCCGDIQGAGREEDYFCLPADFCSPVVVDEDLFDVVEGSEDVTIAEPVNDTQEPPLDCCDDQDVPEETLVPDAFIDWGHGEEDGAHGDDLAASADSALADGQEMDATVDQAEEKDDTGSSNGCAMSGKGESTSRGGFLGLLLMILMSTIYFRRESSRLVNR